MSLIIDILVILLLIITIVNCMFLMRKLAKLRSAQSELRSIITNFSESIAKAEQGVVALKKAGEDAALFLDEKIERRHRDLVKQISKASELANDLDYMTNSGNKLTKRLEGLFTKLGSVHENEHNVRTYGDVGDQLHSGLSENEKLSPEDKSNNLKHRKLFNEDNSEKAQKFNTRSEVERDLIKALKLSK